MWGAATGEWPRQPPGVLQGLLPPLLSPPLPLHPPSVVFLLQPQETPTPPVSNPSWPRLYSPPGLHQVPSAWLSSTSVPKLPGDHPSPQETTPAPKRPPQPPRDPPLLSSWLPSLQETPLLPSIQLPTSALSPRPPPPHKDWW